MSKLSFLNGKRDGAAIVELGFTLLLPIFSALYIWQANKLPDPPGGNILIGPRTFPMLIGELTLIASLVLVWQALRPATPDVPVEIDLIAEATYEPEDASIRDWTGVSVVLGSMLFLGVALRPLGFVMAITLMLFGLSTFFAPRSWLLNLIVAVCFGVGSYLVFTEILMIPLPNGILRSVF
jgi:hypothetical protein